MIRTIILLTGIVLIFCAESYSQGSTTASMNGKVLDINGEGIPGATVVATHNPSGTQYGTITRIDGGFDFPALRIGGPYTIDISFIGFKDEKAENVHLSLGIRSTQNFQLLEEAVELEEVIVTGTGPNGQSKGGSETKISEKDIATLPSISRGLEDFIRLTPQANVEKEGISIAGMNNRYNAIYIDGAVNNDVFGLTESGTNGGATGIPPISIDAIEQIQVVVAPYDVSLGGFTGGGINAVTRSGSNNYEASVYFLTRSEKLAGKTPTFGEVTERTKVDPFRAHVFGGRVGGYLKKNKAFFFFSAEMTREQSPQPFDLVNYSGDASESDLSALEDKLSTYNYDAGGFLNNVSSLSSAKYLTRLDFNLNKSNQLTLRHSFTKADQISPTSSTSREINFFNAGILNPNRTHSLAAELNTLIDNKASNNFIFGYTRVRDDRDGLGSDFPYVNITDGQGEINFGTEEFSTANRLDQDVFTITDNFKLYKNNVTYTIGTHNEFYKIYNLFIRQNFGSYSYASLSDFINDSIPLQYESSYSLVDTERGDASQAGASVGAIQFGLYGQAEWRVSDNFTLTGGLRFDVPIFTKAPKTDENFNNNTIPLVESFGYDLKGAKSGQLPKTQILVSPRIGINAKLLEDKSLTLRGGLGIFTGRVPFVWPAGTFVNNGLTIGSTFQPDPEIVFNPDVNSQPQETDFGGEDPVPSGQLDLFAEKFKYPQVFRMSLAFEKEFRKDVLISLEGIFTKTLNNIFYENLNLKPAVMTLSGTPDNRPLFDRRDEINPTYGRILLASNTSKGFGANFTALLSKSFTSGITLASSYTFGRSKAVFEGTSSQNSSQWRGAISPNGRNNTPLGISDFDLGHRVTGNLSVVKDIFGIGNTTFSLFYNGQSGEVFTYVYNDRGGLNGEDSRERNPVYIPASADEINFVGTEEEQQAQWEALDAFIERDDYLSKHRGQIAEKNGSRTPFEHGLDFRFAQDIKFVTGKKTQRFTLSLDIFNLTNLINKDWGRKFFNDDAIFELIQFEGFESEGNTVPTFSFEEPTAPYVLNDVNLRSRWRMQVGIRYTLN